MFHLTCYEPKLVKTEAIEREDVEPKRIEVDRNLGTDPYQIQERFKRSNFPNPITEDMDEFGKVGAEMSHIQSQMHYDYDSAESIADSDLEDGELRKMLASPLYVQSREDCKSSRIPTASGKLAAMILRKQEPGNQFKSSVFKHADPSNLGRSLLEGNEDHLLSQASYEAERRSWISQ